MAQTRINKFLAEAGICSRREADRRIQAGKVFINGRRAVLGDTVSPNDRVTYNGKVVKPTTQKLYIAFHKPYGVITTTDANSTNTIMEYVQAPTRVYPIGRLDVQSSGLILLTNDGDIVNKLLKSRNKIEKEYVVNVDKPLTDNAIHKLEKGVYLDGRRTLPARISKISPKQMGIIIIQGMNRQIRRMCEKVGYQVTMLKRVRIGNILLKDLPRGKWRYLTPKELSQLRKSLQQG